MGAFLLMYPGRTIMECPKHGSQKNTNQCALSVQQDTLCWCLQSASDSLGVVLPSGLLMAKKKKKKRADKQQAILFAVVADAVS